MSISILILTRNEEVNLPECIKSVQWSDDIVVLDSLSSDRTAEIADTLGARTVQRAFDNWSSHQNYAVQQIDFKHPWVFYIDADERMTKDLALEINTIATSSKKEVAYYVGRRNF